MKTGESQELGRAFHGCLVGFFRFWCWKLSTPPHTTSNQHPYFAPFWVCGRSLLGGKEKKNKQENIGYLVVGNLYVEKNNINKNKCGCASVDGAEKPVKYSLKGSSSKFSPSTRLSCSKSPQKAGDEFGIIILQTAVPKPAHNSRSLWIVVPWNKERESEKCPLPLIQIIYTAPEMKIWLRLNEVSLQTYNPYHSYFMFMEIKYQQKDILD